jgi:hypothetical protein
MKRLEPGLKRLEPGLSLFYVHLNQLQTLF